MRNRFTRIRKLMVFQAPTRSMASVGKDLDKNGNPLDLSLFFRHNPSFVLGPAALGLFVHTVCTTSKALAAKLEDGRHVQYGAYDTMTYTVFAILATFAAHGWFCVHCRQERQIQQFEKWEKRPRPKEGEPAMAYRDRDPPRGASVRSTAALLTSWVYALYPFGAPSTSWTAFICWTCALSIYWDVSFQALRIRPLAS